MSPCLSTESSREQLVAAQQRKVPAALFQLRYEDITNGVF